MSQVLVRTVLVEDDRAVAAIHHGFLLAHGGFEVIGTAATGAAAVEMIVEEEPDLVLLDIHLPDISGVEVLRQIRAAGGHLVDVIAVTAAQEVETVRAAIAGGVLGYLVKPFTMAAMHERLDQYLVGRPQAPPGARLDQSQIDRLLGSATGGRAPATLPKGLSGETLTVVGRALTQLQTASAAQISEAAGVSAGVLGATSNTSWTPDERVGILAMGRLAVRWWTTAWCDCCVGAGGRSGRGVLNGSAGTDRR